MFETFAAPHLRLNAVCVAAMDTVGFPVSTEDPLPEFVIRKLHCFPLACCERVSLGGGNIDNIHNDKNSGIVTDDQFDNIVAS